MSVSLASLPGASARSFGHVRVMGTLGFGVSVGMLPFLLANATGDDPAAETARLRAIFPLAAASVGLEAISRMWLIMLALEVPLVFLFGAGVARIGPRGVIAIGTAAAALRWATSGFVDDLRLVYLAQILHGVTVWGIILGVPFYVDRIVPEHLRATAQSVLAMIGISLGSILSNLTAGFLMDEYGATMPARVAGVASGLLLLAMPFVIPGLHGAEREAVRADVQESA